MWGVGQRTLFPGISWNTSWIVVDIALTNPLELELEPVSFYVFSTSQIFLHCSFRCGHFANCIYLHVRSCGCSRWDYIYNKLKRAIVMRLWYVWLWYWAITSHLSTINILFLEGGNARLVVEVSVSVSSLRWCCVLLGPLSGKSDWRGYMVH